MTIVAGVLAALTLLGLVLVERQRRHVQRFVDEFVPRLEANGWAVTETFWKAPGSPVMVIKASLPNGTNSTIEVKVP